MISIVTTFYNIKNQFINTLKSLEKSSVKDFEVIVVDVASDENERIEHLQNQFKFLKVYRIEKNQKVFYNPCIAFNLAFSKCSGDFIIIQNAECLHYTDILNYTLENINDKDYLSFACYYLDEKTSQQIDEFKVFDEIKKIINFSNSTQDLNDHEGWYNHGVLRPTALHYCSAITKTNLKKLNGFDERYAEGSCFEDKEFLHRVKVKGLNVKIVDQGICIHQFHKKFNNDEQNNHELENKNSNLYNYVTLNENLYRANPFKNIFKQKIIAFTQLRNELSKGNLLNWFKQMDVCDYIYIFDQDSDDGSKEYYKQFKNAVVIESPTNRFHEELICKEELLSKLLNEHKDVDWILWLDGDSLLDGRLLKNNGEELQKLCAYAEANNADACFFNHYNLWRSDIYYRIDDSYHSLNGNLCPLWKNNGNLYFNNIVGLHNKQYPGGLKKGLKTPFSVVHRGFATDYQIITKYDVYKANGQNGWALDRLLNENGLEVEKLNIEMLPEWFELQDIKNPKNKKRIINIYNKEVNRNLEIIGLIYKSESYLDLLFNQLQDRTCKVDGWNIGVRIVANDASLKIINKLKTLNINYSIYNDPKPKDYYLNRVYRCWNFCGQTSEYDNICFVNSDMVFTENWLSNLLKHHNGINIPTSRLIESGKMPSGTHGISFDCGKNPKEIDYNRLAKVSEIISENKILEKGLYMPCIFEKSRFLESGMYPEGNIYRDGVGTLNGFVQSGDDWYFKKLETLYSMKHITAFDSLVYHIQEGEKDE